MVSGGYSSFGAGVAGEIEKYAGSSFALVAKQQPFHCKGGSVQIMTGIPRIAFHFYSNCISRLLIAYAPGPP